MVENQERKNERIFLQKKLKQKISASYVFDLTSYFPVLVYPFFVFIFSEEKVEVVKWRENAYVSVKTGGKKMKWTVVTTNGWPLVLKPTESYGIVVRDNKLSKKMLDTLFHPYLIRHLQPFSLGLRNWKKRKYRKYGKVHGPCSQFTWNHSFFLLSWVLRDSYIFCGAVESRFIWKIGQAIILFLFLTGKISTMKIDKREKKMYWIREERASVVIFSCWRLRWKKNWWVCIFFAKVATSHEILSVLYTSQR